MNYLCGFLIVVVLVTVVGHLLWLAVAAIVRAISGAASEPKDDRPRRPFRYCPACGSDTEERDRNCIRCDLELDSRIAYQLHRIRIAEREVGALIDRAQLDPEAAAVVLNQLENRARSLQGLPAKSKQSARPRAKPIAETAPGQPVAPANAVALVPPPEVEAAPPATEPAAPLPIPESTPEVSEPLPPVITAVEASEPASLTPEPPDEPPAPKPRRGGFLEEHNILWGELVGGLLIVGCSIALVVTLRQTLEDIPYFRFLLSAAVTIGLFGAGQYTLHRWKLSGTSRGMLVISMLLTPITLLLLAAPFTKGTDGLPDVAVKVAALAAFVGVVRTGGRDLIGTEHLPGPVDRRWLLALAVVGAAGTQLLPTNLALAWLPLACFAVACGATLGGLSWYSAARRDVPVTDKSGTALLMFVGVAAFALVAAWSLYVVREAEQMAARLHALAVPLALASVPVVEAGVLVLRRVASAGRRTVGTAVALTGFVTMTTGLMLAWPDPLALLLVSAATGLYLTRVAFREKLPWVHVGAISLLGFAAVLTFHGITGNWSTPTALNEKLGSVESGAVLVGFALVLASLAELLARGRSRQTASYAIGALCVGLLGLLLVSWNGTDHPAHAAFAHAAGALGLLASNYRWKRRALAHGGLWLILVGTLWALWWQAPHQPAMWGFVVAVEAFVFTAGAVALRGSHGGATALLRRAGRDVSFAACAVALFIATTSLTLESAWHTGTLFTLALTAVALARLTGTFVFTWVGSVAALLGALHLGVFTWNVQPETLAIEIAILTHATLAAFCAVLCRRQARVFGDPLRWVARLSSALAMPLLFFPAFGFAYATSGLAVWLGVLWLAFVLLWRERGAFSAFQAAITLGALLVAFGWIEEQDWWRTTSLTHRDPRAMHAFGLAIGVLAIAWAIARHALQANSRLRELWCDNPLSLDRFTLGTAVIGFFVLGAVAVLPGVGAELTPFGAVRFVIAPPELAHAFDAIAWVLLAVLAVAVLLSWRLSKIEHDTDVHAIALVPLALAAPLVWAGTHAADIAVASALRWSLALAFVAGAALVAIRVPLRRGAEAIGFAARPSPWLRPWLLALFTVAAGVVVVLSTIVAEIGLSRLKPGGPLEASPFAQMGAMLSNLVPLALVVFGLATCAGRERSSGYALSGGLVFVATLTAGYALSVVTAGKPLDGTEQTRLLLVLAGSAAVWALLWLLSEWRVPGGVPLMLQVLIGFGALSLVCFVPTMRLLGNPGAPLPASVGPLGSFGWSALVLVAGAGFWHTRRAQPEAGSLVFAFAGLIAGVLVAAGVSSWDEPDRWLSFHALALTWLAVGGGFCTTLSRVRLSGWWLTCFASLLVVCALRAGWFDPWKPWLPAGLSLAAALFFGALALRTRGVVFAGVSGLAVNLAGIFVWIAWGSDTLAGFFLANAAGVAVASICWTLVRIRQRASAEGSAWLEPLDGVIIPAFALLLLGLGPTFAATPTDPYLAWGALVAVALACAVGLWDRVAMFARPGLFTVGALAALLIVAEADTRPIWDVPATALALAAYALGVACIALALSRRTKPLLGMHGRGDSWPWLLGALPLLAVFGSVLGLRIGLIWPGLLDRLANPSSVAVLAISFAVLARVYSDTVRESLQTLSAALGVGALAALAWAIPEPQDRYVWLHRNGWLFVALAFAAVAGSEVAARLGESWRRALRNVAGCSAVLALAVLCLNLLQQVPVYDPIKRITPLAREASLAMLAGIAGLFVLALRFALKPERDPLALRLSLRTAYVYLAEVLIVVFFVQIRFNVPELFIGQLAKVWTFAVMALAYVGIGLAELFERKKIDVFAGPLRRTGVLLPLIPLLAFWAKPPGFVNEFAESAAPGLVPLLGYLKNLPQHFDMYAWLWFLAGGVYGLLALSRKSFGWALLAALSTNAAMWALLAHNGVPFFVHPQAWVIPLALIVLVSEHINRRRLSAEVSNGMRYGGVAMIYVASSADMFIAGVGNSMWLPVLLAVFCVLGVLTGMLLRVRAFIYLGVGFLLLDIFSMIWHAAVNLQQTWVWYVSGIVLGVVVLGLFTYLEKRRGQAGKEPTEGE